MARNRRLIIALPEVVWDALYAEASRTYERPATVAERVLTDALTDYVAGQLRRDLATLTNSGTLAPSDDPRPGSDALG
jgi:hypothetical protein